MTVTIELPPDLERELRRRADARGQDLATYARELIEGAIRPAAETPQERLRGAVVAYDDPFGPAVAPENWGALD